MTSASNLLPLAMQPGVRPRRLLEYPHLFRTCAVILQILCEFHAFENPSTIFCKIRDITLFLRISSRIVTIAFLLFCRYFHHHLSNTRRNLMSTDLVNDHHNCRFSSPFFWDVLESRCAFRSSRLALVHGSTFFPSSSFPTKRSLLCEFRDFIHFPCFLYFKNLLLYYYMYPYISLLSHVNFNIDGSNRVRSQCAWKRFKRYITFYYRQYFLYHFMQLYFFPSGDT